MSIIERCAPMKPFQHLFAFQAARLVGIKGVVRGLMPFAEISDETMLLRIEVDIVNQICKIVFIVNQDSAKRFLKQATAALIHLVKRFGVRVKEI